jgi:hypothetical protein
LGHTSATDRPGSNLADCRESGPRNHSPTRSEIVSEGSRRISFVGLSGVTRNVRNNLLEITYLPESEIFGVNRSKMVAVLILDEVLQLANGCSR